MTLTFQVGWWMLPVAVLIGNLVWFLWPRPDEWNDAGAYSWPLGMFMLTSCDVIEPRVDRTINDLAQWRDTIGYVPVAGGTNGQ